MYKATAFIVVSLLFSACASQRYPNWQYVRIETAIPKSKSCEYKIQEACTKTGGECLNWYKRRATTFGANTVVITQTENQLNVDGWSYANREAASQSVTANELQVALADYYFCQQPLN